MDKIAHSTEPIPRASNQSAKITPKSLPSTSPIHFTHITVDLYLYFNAVAMLIQPMAASQWGSRGDPGTEQKEFNAASPSLYHEQSINEPPTIPIYYAAPLTTATLQYLPLPCLTPRTSRACKSRLRSSTKTSLFSSPAPTRAF